MIVLVRIVLKYEFYGMCIMKTEIKHEGIWWTFDATCDRCGKLIQDCTVSQTYEPDLQEPDFCMECIRYFLDNNIPYEIVKQQYKW